MSVQIKIGTGGTFPATTANQSDMVFWYNDDGNKKSHYPIPRCENLEVAPGQTTPAYQPIPQPAFPTTITYICALHPQTESGQLTVDDDPGGPAQTAGTVGSTTKTIEIGAGGKFPSIDVAQSDQVAWKNNDKVTHWPVPNCSGLLVKPQAVSNGAQFFPPPLVAPLPISYGCAIAGHESEQGVINVYADFLIAGTAFTLSSNLPYQPVIPFTGGRSPYKITGDSSYSYITAEELPAGSSTGVSLILNDTPPSKGVINYNLSATDANGTTLTQTLQITVS